jgi:hypothetical protein
MKRKLNDAGILPLCILFAALAFVCISCTGSYSDPGIGGGSSSGSSNDDDDEGQENGVKPAHLAISATAAEALAKLNEIIAYSGTPDAAKTAAQTLRNSWSYFSPNWSTISISTITAINVFIDQIP